MTTMKGIESAMRKVSAWNFYNRLRHDNTNQPHVHDHRKQAYIIRLPIAHDYCLRLMTNVVPLSVLLSLA